MQPADISKPTEPKEDIRIRVLKRKVSFVLLRSVSRQDTVLFRVRGQELTRFTYASWPE